MTSPQLFEPRLLIEAANQDSGNDRPSIAGASELLMLAYQASLFREESTPVRGTYVLADSGVDWQLLLEFQSPPVVTTQWMRKVGIGFEAGRTAILVTWDGTRHRAQGVFSFEENSLILSILDRTLCLIEVRDSAVLRYARGESSVHFVRGAIRAEHSLEQIAQMFPAYFFHDVKERLMPGVFHIFHSRLADEPSWRGRVRLSRLDAPPLPLASVLREVMRICVRQGRGLGMLVLCRAEFEEQLQAVIASATDVAEARRSSRPFAWSDAVQHAVVSSCVLDEGGRALRPSEHWQQQLLRTGRRLAHLSAVDGALVLGPLLAPVAVGAKLVVRESDFAGLPPQLRSELAHRGTRHKSIASACNAIESSLGVVVSSDGELLLVSNCPVSGFQWTSASV